jgi:hypothetical protein
LRGVTLVGIDSVVCEPSVRAELWGKLASDWSVKSLDVLAREVSLDQLSPEITQILAGKQQGRVLVNLWA